MQILTSKSGSRLKLNETEKRKLTEALRLCFAIEKHADSPLTEDAGLACTYLEKVIELAQGVEPITA
jgi:hypothetical protein